jgi:hypothetical protein
MLTYSVKLLHDNVCLHTAPCAPSLLGHFKWELFDYPPYSLHPALSNYYLKNLFGSQCLNNNEELMEGVKTWLSSQVANFFDTGNTKTYSPARQAPQFRW